MHKNEFKETEKRLKMNENQLKRDSKFLSLILRHQPERIGIQLDEQGWVSVDELLQQLNKHGKKFDLNKLQEVVENNNKKRFAFNEDASKIRANQGHSVQINLGYEATAPPEILFHGTATRFLDSIKATGLQKRSRHHVHLSADKDTAENVGKRHGKVIILQIKAQAMQEAGFEFYLSENKVWLTDNVPVEYIIF